MISLLLSTAVAIFKSRRALILENLALRHQIGILQRPGKRPRLKSVDRGLWVFLSRVYGEWKESLILVKPDTVVGWHKKGFRLYWKRKSRKQGRPRTTRHVIDLIRRMSRENPLWGSPKIHGELKKLGIVISQTSIGRYMIRPPGPPSQTWGTFLKNHLHNTVSIDFFTVPTISFKVLYVFLILSHERRRIIHFNITEYPSSRWTALQLMQAFPWDTAPKYLVRDRDGKYGREVLRAIHNLHIEDCPTARRSPWQNPYVERVIGSIRHECLDHMIILGEKHLRKVLREYFQYYHESRTHLGLDKDCPEHREIEPPEMGKIVAIPQVGGLHHRYTRKAA